MLKSKVSSLLVVMIGGALTGCGADAPVDGVEAAPVARDVDIRAGDPGPSPTMAPPAPGPPFDTDAAVVALAAVNVQSCKKTGGPVGPGYVTVTFIPSGSVSSAVVAPPFAGTTVGACVSTRFRAVHVPAFGGYPVVIGKKFFIL